jgi:hypothetical protein
VPRFRVKKLSNVPSEILEQALGDLIQCRKDGIVINMETWVAVRPEPYKCECCLAGAMLIKNCTTNLLDVKGCSHFYWFGDFSDAVQRKMEFLNCVRNGDVELALKASGRKPVVPSRRVVLYSSDPSKWMRQMRQIVKQLRKHGL